MSLSYYEDLDQGASWTYGPYELTEAEIVEFATKYDPQPMHVDPEAAHETPVGELIASGIHLIAISGRLLVDNFYGNVANVVGLGIRDIEFRNPGRPGDELWLRQEVGEKRVSESNPDHGIVDLDRTLVNQHDDPVLTLTGTTLFERRCD